MVHVTPVTSAFFFFFTILAATLTQWMKSSTCIYLHKVYQVIQTHAKK